MNCIFIYNPNSGKGKIARKISLIEKRLQDAFGAVTIKETASPEDTTNIARSAALSYKIIVIAGGDGTLNDACKGIIESGKMPYIGYIPTGTANDIARNLKIPKCINKALQIIAGGNYIKQDVGRINNRYFIYVACTGTFAAVSYRTKQKLKRTCGRIAYVFDGVKDIIKPSLLDIKLYNGSECLYHGTSPLFLILNSKGAGGIEFNKQGHRNDGTFDVIIVTKTKGKGIASIAKTMLLGVRQRKTKYYESYRLSSFKVETGEDVVWTLDGEEGERGTMHVTCLMHALNVFAGNVKGEKIFSIFKDKDKCE